MQEQARISVWIAKEIRRWEMAEVARARRAREASPIRPPIRRSVGRSIVRFGERVAAEPSIQPARSR